MRRGNIHARLERLRERVGPSDSLGRSEAWEKAKRVLDTLHNLLLEHGDEIDRDYKEHMERGENPKSALVAVKREAVSKTEEGRKVWAFLEAVEERGRGRGHS